MDQTALKSHRRTTFSYLWLGNAQPSSLRKTVDDHGSLNSFALKAGIDPASICRYLQGRILLASEEMWARIMDAAGADFNRNFIGTPMAEAMKAKRLSKAGLAEAIGAADVNGLLEGKRIPTEAEHKAIMDILGSGVLPPYSEVAEANGLVPHWSRPAGDLPHLRKIRTGLGLTQGALADLVGLHQRDVSNLEGGRRNVPEELVQAVAAALGVDPDDLRNGLREGTVPQITTRPSELTHGDWAKRPVEELGRDIKEAVGLMLGASPQTLAHMLSMLRRLRIEDAAAPQGEG